MHTYIKIKGRGRSMRLISPPRLSPCRGIDWLCKRKTEYHDKYYE